MRVWVKWRNVVDGETQSIQKPQSAEIHNDDSGRGLGLDTPQEKCAARGHIMEIKTVAGAFLNPIK